MARTNRIPTNAFSADVSRSHDDWFYSHRISHTTQGTLFTGLVCLNNECLLQPRVVLGKAKIKKTFSLKCWLQHSFFMKSKQMRFEFWV